MTQIDDVVPGAINFTTEKENASNTAQFELKNEENFTVYDRGPAIEL